MGQKRAGDNKVGARELGIGSWGTGPHRGPLPRGEGTRFEVFGAGKERDHKEARPIVAAIWAEWCGVVPGTNNTSEPIHVEAWRSV